MWSSPANQLRILSQNFSNLARTIGNLFLPIVSKVLPYINAMVVALQRLFTWVGSLLGIKFNSINSSMGGISDSVANLGDSADDAESSLTNAEKAAKKLKNTVLAIDELNINDPTSGSSGSGTSTTPSGGGSGILDDAINDELKKYQDEWDKAFDRMDDKIKKFSDAICDYFKKMYDATEPFRNALKKLWDEGLSKLANFTWTALKDFYENLLVPLGKWAFGTENMGLTRLVDIINNSLMKIQWDEINKNLKDFWKAIEPYAEQFGEGLIDFFEDCSNVAVDIINKLFGKDSLLTNLVKTLNNNDPAIARKWGYALGVLFASVSAYKTASAAVKVIENLAKNLNAIATIGVVAATVYVGIEFSKDYKEWKDNIDKWGWDTGRKITASNNPANPYKNDSNKTNQWENNGSDAMKYHFYGYDKDEVDKQLEVLKKSWNDTIGEISKSFSDWWTELTTYDYSFDNVFPNAKNLKEDWNTLWSNISLTFQAKWSDIKTWWETSALYLWWTENVEPWFTAEKWSLLWDNVSLSFQTKWQEIKDWWTMSALYLWWIEDVAPWFSLETWLELLQALPDSFK